MSHRRRKSDPSASKSNTGNSSSRRGTNEVRLVATESARLDSVGRELPEHVPAFPPESRSEHTVLGGMFRSASVTLLGVLVCLYPSVLTQHIVPLPSWLVRLLGGVLAAIAAETIAARIRQILVLMRTLRWHGWRAVSAFIMMHPRNFREYFIAEVWIAGRREPNFEFGLIKWIRLLEASPGSQRQSVVSGPEPNRAPHRTNEQNWSRRPSIGEQLARADREGVFIRTARSRKYNNLSMLLLPAILYLVWSQIPERSAANLNISGTILLMPALALVVQTILVALLLLEGTGKRSMWWVVARNNGYGFLVMRYVCLVAYLIVTFSVLYWLLSVLRPNSFNSKLTKIDAVYFTMTIFTTTGFGDINATAETSRLFVSIQMLFGFLVVSIGVAAAFARAGWMPSRTEGPPSQSD